MPDESRIWIAPSSSVARSRNASIGSDSLIYFERVGDGRLIIPPVTWAPDPVCRLPKPHERDRNCLCGYVRREARSAHDLERVSKRYEAQKKCEFAAIDEKHQARMSEKMAKVRSRLHHIMATTKSQWERDFIRLALKRLEEGERGFAPRRIEGAFHIEGYEAKRGK